jgi:hypothetical protein
MIFPKLKKEGFALLAVLALISVLTLLLGALMAGHRSSFTMLKRGYASDRIDRTHNSVFALCQQKLEQDYTWGKSFSGQKYSSANLTVTENEDDSANPSDLQILSGRDAANQTDFKVKICNNLTGRVTLLADLDSGKRDGVPSGFCRMQITASVDQQSRTVEVLVRNPGLVGAGLLANGDLKLSSNHLSMFSKDPIKNQARAMGEVFFTGSPDFMFGETTSSADQSVRSDNPMIWAGGKANFRKSIFNGFQDRESFKQSYTSQDFRDERFKDMAKSRFEIPDIDLADLAEVRGPDESTKPTYEIPAGVYEFQQFTYADSQVRVMVRRQSDTATGDPRDSNGKIEQFWYMSDAEAGSAGYPTTAEVASRIGASSARGSDHKGQRYANLGAPGAQVDLLQRRVVLDDRYNFEVRGDFALRAASTGNGEEESYGIKPSIFFANPEVLPEQNFLFNTSTEVAETDDTNRGDLRCEGRVHLEGDVIGSATIAGKDDVTLAPTRFNDAKGNSEVDFSIYSGGDVRIVPPRLWELNDNRDSSYDQKRSNISQNNLLFTGLIYARGSVSMNLHDTEFQTQTRTFEVEGAVVALGGDLSVKNADEVKITYNPMYVDRLVPSFFKGNQNRIEVTGWRHLR